MRLLLPLVIVFAAHGCAAKDSAPRLAQNDVPKPEPTSGVTIVRPPLPDTKFLNVWPEEWQKAFDERAKHAITLFAGKGYGDQAPRDEP